MLHSRRLRSSSGSISREMGVAMPVPSWWQNWWRNWKIEIEKSMVRGGYRCGSLALFARLHTGSRQAWEPPAQAQVVRPSRCSLCAQSGNPPWSGESCCEARCVKNSKSDPPNRFARWMAGPKQTWNQLLWLLSNNRQPTLRTDQKNQRVTNALTISKHFNCAQRDPEAARSSSSKSGLGVNSNLEPTKFVILRIFGPNFVQIWQFWCFWKAEIEIYPNLAKLNWEEIQILSKSRIWV